MSMKFRKLKKITILISKQNYIFQPNFTFHIYQVVNSTIKIFNSLLARNGRIVLTFGLYYIISICIN